MKVNNWQIYRFAFVYLYSQNVAFLLPRLFGMSNYYGWIALLGGYTISGFFLLLTVKLGRLYPDKPFQEFGARIIGKWPHKAVLAFITLYTLALIGIDVENFIVFLHSMYMPDTPVWITIMLTVLCISLAGRSGLLTIVYMAEGIFLLQLFTTATTVPPTISQGNYDVLVSMITNHDWKQIIVHSSMTVAWFTEWIVMLFLVPTYSFNRRTMRYLFFAGFTVVLLVIMYWMICLINFGPYLSAQLRYPLLELIRYVRFGDFLDNLDPVLISVWSTTMFIRSSFLMYVCSNCVKEIFNINKRRMLTFMIGGTVAITALQYSRDPSSYEMALRSYALYFNAIIINALPLLYLLVHRIRFGRQQPEENGSSADQHNKTA